jgi:hypothetical protein
MLTNNLLFDGVPARSDTPGWEHTVSNGSIVIVTRMQANTKRNMIELVADVDFRVNELVKLLAVGILDDSGISAFFIQNAKLWLSRAMKAHNPERQPDIFKANDESDATAMLIYAKLVQEILEKLKHKLTGNPTQVSELINQLLNGFVDEAKMRMKRNDAKSPSLAAMSRIAKDSSPESQKSEFEEPSEIASIALSLLSSILTSPKLSTSSIDNTLLSSLEQSLTFIATSAAAIVPQPVSTTARNLLTLLNFHTSSQSTSSPNAPDLHAEDRKTYSLALSYLTDPSAPPPVRAQGLSLLATLITNSSPVLDIPSTLILLLSLLQDSEEYIYLSSIGVIQKLAEKHLKSVCKMLVERYVDIHEELGLDARLRVGEALVRIVERAGELFVGDVARLVIEGMLDVGGRRGTKPKEFEKRQKAMRMEEEKLQEARNAWGGEVPSIGQDDGHEAANEVIRKIVEGWEGTNKEDDVRIRTSALSIFGNAIETNITGIGASLTSAGVDLAMSVLTIERDAEKAILRRAAALIVMSLIRALDKAREQGENLGFGLVGESLDDVLRVLGFVRDTDADHIVRQHASDVIEGLDSLRANTILGFSASEKAGIMPQLELNSLAGLSINPDRASASKSPRIVEIE